MNKMSENIRRSDCQMLEPTIYGIGINDVDYAVRKYEELLRVNGKRRQKVVWVCPYYQKWASMIQRCHSKTFLEKRPSYKGCSVSEEWRYLSNFIKWVDSQPVKDWQNCQLDKDFLVQGNKVYSSETCIFIPSQLNTFILGSGGARGDYMIGVDFESRSKKNPYQAHCRNPFTKKKEHLGLHPTELEAHLAWQYRKHELALQLADNQVDSRVASRLREMYAPDKDWSNK